MVSRPLTDGEIKLAKTVFGDAIDYARVSVNDTKFIGFHPKGTAMAPNGSLYMFGCYHADYSALPPHGQSLFIHEMTHVWQYQNKVLKPVVEAVKLNLAHKFNYDAAYDYTLDAKKDLLAYNMEQQASIVQDYFVLRETGAPSPFARSQTQIPHGQARTLYETVLQNFLTDPAYARKDAKNGFSGKPKPPKA